MLAELLVVPCPESDHVGCLPPKSLKSLNCRPFFEFWLIFVDSFVKKPTPPSTDPTLRPESGVPKLGISGPPN